MVETDTPSQPQNVWVTSMEVNLCHRILKIKSHWTLSTEYLCIEITYLDLNWTPIQLYFSMLKIKNQRFNVKNFNVGTLITLKFKSRYVISMHKYSVLRIQWLFIFKIRWHRFTSIHFSFVMLNWSYLSLVGYTNLTMDTSRTPLKFQPARQFTSQSRLLIYEWNSERVPPPQ